MNKETHYSLDDLCKASGLPVRTVRYYIQSGLVERPEGGGRGAFYTQRHLDQLLLVLACQRKGMSLDAIREFATRAEPARSAPPAPRVSGGVEVWTHLYIQEGVELHIEPGRAGLTPEQVRALFRETLALYERIKRDKKP
jgi:DNA-binding transcriptional MerR regulator